MKLLKFAGPVLSDSCLPQQSLPTLEQSLPTLEQSLPTLEQSLPTLETLQAVASARVALSCAAQCINNGIRAKSLHRGEENHPISHVASDNPMDVTLLGAVAALCTETWSYTIKVFLIKQVVHLCSMDVFRLAIADSRFGLAWMVPNSLQHDEGENAIPDRFILLGESYRRVRESVASTVLSSNAQSLQSAVETATLETRQATGVELLLALYREVTMCRAEGSEYYVIDEAKIAALRDFVTGCELLRGRSQDLAFQFIENEQGASFSHLAVSPNQDGMIRSLSALVVHFACMLSESNAANNLLQVFSRLAFKPSSMGAAMLPTMPEDPLPEIREVLQRNAPYQNNPHFYECPNGHPYYISECGNPQQAYSCTVCKESIGGTSSVLVSTNRVAGTGDKSQVGHILGAANCRIRLPVPERHLNNAATSLMRILLHMSLTWASSASNHGEMNSLRGMIHPALPQDTNVGQFFWEHLMHDIQMFALATGKGIDDVLLSLHWLIADMADGRHRPEMHVDSGLLHRHARQEWEVAFHQEYFAEFFGSIDDAIATAKQAVHNDDRLQKDRLMRAVFEIETSSNGDAHREEGDHLDPSLWRYRVRPSIDGLMHTLAPQRENYPILYAFLEDEHKLRAVQYLPEIVQLQRRLVDRYSRRIDRNKARNMTVKDFMAEQPDAESMIAAYRHAWMLVRAM